jgi:hypothetical protein
MYKVPSTTFQFLLIVSLLYVCQPAIVLPSNSNCQPSAASLELRVLVSLLLAMFFEELHALSKTKDRHDANKTFLYIIKSLINKAG